MRYYLFTILVSFIFSSIQAQHMHTLHELDHNYSSDYFETIAFYTALAENHDIIQVNEYGKTDSGHPLHEVIIDVSKSFQPNLNSVRYFVNNGIHPGEPCGIDASQQWVRSLCDGTLDAASLEGIQIILIPVYNIGGALNRGSHSRANQDGPKEYGFRGNAKNLDLNRDFIKCDSKNAQSFNQLFNKWRPQIFVDTHTSNGADYQYTMTLIPTQKDRLGGAQAELMQNDMLSYLYEKMEEKGWEMTPYVYARKTPDDGIYGFLDLARYSSGYAATHGAISFMPETHMLKPYKDRVASTKAFLESMLSYIQKNPQKIKNTYDLHIQELLKKVQFDINWTVDMEAQDAVLFKGYEAKYKPSVITGQDRLYYDRNDPYEKSIPFWNTYKSTTSIKAPTAYIIPQAYDDVIQRLKMNGVQVDQVQKDAMVTGSVYKIGDFKTRESAYEGHYLHYDIELEEMEIQKKIYAGDYIVKTQQQAKRYIIEVLEPHAPDSFFAWNFFDGILMQKEHFSSYVFEDLAVEILSKHPEIKVAFEHKKAQDSEFAENARAQLNFIYEQSPHYEYTHMLYPVMRIHD